MFKLIKNEQHSGPTTLICNIEGFGKEFVVLLSKLHKEWEFEVYSADGRFPKIIFPNLKIQEPSFKDIEDHFNNNVLDLSHKFVKTMFENRIYV